MRKSVPVAVCVRAGTLRKREFPTPTVESLQFLQVHMRLHRIDRVFLNKFAKD